MASDIPQDPGPHWSLSDPDSDGSTGVDLQPSPRILTPSEEQWRRGCQLLRLDPETATVPDSLSDFPEYPGRTRAEQFLELAAENGGEYDLSTMPQTWAKKLVGVVFAEWAHGYHDASR